MADRENYLVQMCYDGKLKEVRDAIADGASVNSTGNISSAGYNITCLMSAAMRWSFPFYRNCCWTNSCGNHDHVEVLSLLLKHPEIDVDAKDDDNLTAIHRVCASGDTMNYAHCPKSTHKIHIE